MELHKILNEDLCDVQELHQGHLKPVHEKTNKSSVDQGHQKPVQEKRNKCSVDHGQQTPENQKRNKTSPAKNSSVQILQLCFDNKLQKWLDTEISKEIICNVGSDLRTCKDCTRRITLLQKACTKLCFMCDIENPSIHDLYWNMDQVQNTVHTTGLPAFASKRHIQDLYKTLKVRQELCIKNRHITYP